MIAAVAMSGGVDSSVVAAVLKNSGYEVIGLTMLFGLNPPPSGITKPSLVPDSMTSARTVASNLEIKHYAVDLSHDFKKKVLNYFSLEYARGRTPNPCVVCNRELKFGALLNHAKSLGAVFLATGHYANIKRTGQEYSLHKATYEEKDQSYFLYSLDQSRLKYLQFPLGTYSKENVRKMAAEMNLRGILEKESRDLCFIKGDYRDLLNSVRPSVNGDILDIEGDTAGRHRGLGNYTIGQRVRLPGRPERLFVLEMDSQSNIIIVGPEKYLYSSLIFANNAVWVGGDKPDNGILVKVRIRSRAAEADARLEFSGNGIILKFSIPQRAVAFGQSVVLYSGDRVLGGGIIESREGFKNNQTYFPK